MTDDADLDKQIRQRMLDAVDDLRRQVERNELQSLAYAAHGDKGNVIVTSVTNVGLKPITLLGALEVLQHRIVDAVNGGPSLEYSSSKDDLGGGEPLN